jgi:hypothetical protein
VIDYLQISKLSELFTAFIKLALEGLNLLMDYLVCPNVPALGKGLAADIATVWTLTSVTTLVGLRID